MAKTPSLTQQLLTWTENRALSPVKHSLIADVAVDCVQTSSQWVQRLNRAHNGSSVGTVICVGVIALFVWNWQLLTALTLGPGVALLAYRGLPVQKWMRSMVESPVAIASLLGLFSVIVSYGTLLIWQDTGHLGIALTVLLQGACTVLALALLGWQLVQPSDREPAEETYDCWVTQLTAPQPLQRLIAVRRLSQIEVLATERRQELSEYFQLLLAQESHPQIRDAVLEGLKQLDTLAISRSKSRIPRQRLLQIKRRIKMRKQRVYAELEAHPEESWVQ